MLCSRSVVILYNDIDPHIITLCEAAPSDIVFFLYPPENVDIEHLCVCVIFCPRPKVLNSFFVDGCAFIYLRRLPHAHTNNAISISSTSIYKKHLHEECAHDIWYEVFLFRARLPLGFSPTNSARTRLKHAMLSKRTKTPFTKKKSRRLDIHVNAPHTCVCMGVVICVFNNTDQM